MNRNITIKELKEIFQFLQQKQLRHYDLQIEMADHLATAIEAQWIEDPELPLQTALDLEFKKFGITGFSYWVQKKKRTADWLRIKDINGQLIRHWIKSPKVFLTIALFLIIAQLLNHPITAGILIQAVFVGTWCLVLFGMIQLWRFRKQINKKLFTLETQFNLGGGLMSFTLIPATYINGCVLYQTVLPFWETQLLAFLILTTALLVYEYVFIRIPKLKEDTLAFLAIHETTFA